MRKSRFSEAQIIGMIKEQEAGMPTEDVCRAHHAPKYWCCKFEFEVDFCPFGPFIYLCFFFLALRSKGLTCIVFN